MELGTMKGLAKLAAPMINSETLSAIRTRPLESGPSLPKSSPGLGVELVGLADKMGCPTPKVEGAGLKLALVPVPLCAAPSLKPRTVIDNCDQREFCSFLFISLVLLRCPVLPQRGHSRDQFLY